MTISAALKTCPTCGAGHHSYEEAWEGDVETQNSQYTGDIVITYDCGAVYRITEFNQTLWIKECPRA